MIIQMFSIIVKNLRLLVRSRSSAMIVILGPLLLMLLVGAAFNSVGTRDVEIGIYSEKYTPVTLSYVKTLSEGPFRTLKYVSEEACVEHIKRGVIATCIIFPPDMVASDSRVDEIVFYVDFSRVNIVYQILESVRKEVGSASNQISMDLTDNLLDALTAVQSDINKTQPKVNQLGQHQRVIALQVNNVSEDLEGFNVRFDRDDLDVEQATMGLGEAQHSVTDIYESHQFMGDTCKSMVNKGLQRAMSCASSTEEEEDLQEELDVDKIYAREGDLDTAYMEVQQEFNRSRMLLLALDKQLDMLEKDLATVQVVREDARDELKSVDSALNQAGQRTKEVTDSLNGIYKDIDGIHLRNALHIVTPVTTDIRPVVPETTNLLYLFPTLLAMVLMLSMILLSSTLVITEKKSRAYFRNFITPTGALPHILGIFTTTLLVGMIQMGILLTITSLYFHMTLVSDVQSAVVLLLLLASIFSLIGLFIGYLFNSEDTVTLGAISASSLLLFLSDVIMPLESMPEYISKLAAYNPFVLGSQSIKKALLFGVGLDGLYSYVILFIVYSAVLFVCLMLLERAMKKRAIYKLTNQYAIKREKKKLDLLVREEDTRQEVEQS